MFALPAVSGGNDSDVKWDATRLDPSVTVEIANCTSISIQPVKLHHASHTSIQSFKPHRASHTSDSDKSALVKAFAPQASASVARETYLQGRADGWREGKESETSSLARANFLSLR